MNPETSAPISVEWNTPAYIVEPYQTLVGVIHLDPFSNALANRTIQADNYFHKHDSPSSLKRFWANRTNPINIWMNPPYGNLLAPCIYKFIREWKRGHIKNAAILVRGDSKALKTLQRLPGIIWVEFNQRIEFIDADTNIPGGSPVPGYKLFYLGEFPLKFSHLYEPLGMICSSYLNCNKRSKQNP